MRETWRIGACETILPPLRKFRFSLREGLWCAALAGYFAAPLALPARCAAADANKNTAGEAVNIADMTTRVDDLQASIHIIKCDSKELEKIGQDFQRTYQFQEMLRNVMLEYKQPDKLRLSGKNAILGKASIVMNGSLRCFHVPLKPAKAEDLTDSPGKRQSLLEFGGLLAPATLNFMQGKFVRQETLEGQTASVFDLTYKGVAGGSHYRVWFDPHTRLTLKREWYDYEGKLKATFFYQEPKEVSAGVWLPTQVEVKNADGVSAAITTIDNVKINQGLPDTLFNIAH